MRLEPAARYQACTLVLHAPDFAFMDTLQLPARTAPATASAAGGVADADADLMLAYAGGDGDGFAGLYERHKGGVYRYFLRSLRDGGLAEELAQDVWASVIRGRAGYRPEAKFTTWLYRLAHNRLIDHYRRSSVVVFSPLEPDTDDGETGQHHPSPAPGPEDVTHHRAAARRLPLSAIARTIRSWFSFMVIRRVYRGSAFAICSPFSAGPTVRSRESCH